MNLSENDIKEMILPIGIVKKIFRLNPKADAVSSTEGHDISFSPPSFSSLQYISPGSPTLSMSSASTALSSSSASNIVIPDRWRHETELCIQSKELDTTAHSEIARTLVTLLTSKFGTNFGRKKIDEVARK